MLALLLSVPLRLPWLVDLDKATYDAMWRLTYIATFIFVAGLVAIPIGLHAWRIRRFWHRHFTADGRQVARRLQEIAR